MPLILLFLGLGGAALAWGWKRQRTSERGMHVEPGPRDTFPWEKSEEPPPAARLSSKAASMADAFARRYDVGLTEEEVQAIVWAREHESEPKNLDAFAASLAPDFPIAVARLREQARQLRRAPWRQVTSTSVALAEARLASRLSGEDGGESEKWSTFFILPGFAFAPDSPQLARELDGRLARGEITHEEWERLISPPAFDLELEARREAWAKRYAPLLDTFENTKIPVSRFTWGLGGPDTRQPPEAPPFEMKLGDALREAYYDAEAEKNKALEKKSFFSKLFSALGDAFDFVASVYTFSLKYVAAPVLSYIPGLGTIAAVVVTVAADIARGQTVDQALIDGAAAAAPGQPMSGIAVKTAYSAVRAAAQGERFDAIALSGLRDGIFASLPADVKSLGQAAYDAIDTSFALAQAKDLQDAGWAIFSRMARGNDLTTKAVSFSTAMADAEKLGRTVKDVLESRIVTSLSSVTDAADKALPVVDAISKNPQLGDKSPAELGAVTGVPEPVAHAALASMRPIPIPEWLKKRLGLGTIFYPDPDFLAALERKKKIVALPSLQQTEPLRFAQIVAQREDRKRWVARYLQEKNVSEHPFLKAESSTVARGPRGF